MIAIAALVASLGTALARLGVDLANRIVLILTHLAVGGVPSSPRIAINDVVGGRVTSCATAVSATMPMPFPTSSPTGPAAWTSPALRVPVEYWTTSFDWRAPKPSAPLHPTVFESTTAARAVYTTPSVVPLISEAVEAARARDWQALKRFLHPYMLLISEGGTTLRGRTNVLKWLASCEETLEPPESFDLRDGQIYRWTARQARPTEQPTPETLGDIP